MNRFLEFGSLLVIGLLVHYASAAENWPQWRGPLGTGVAADGEYPVKFSADEGLGWKVKLPGRGSSTPVVWDDRIFVTCEIGGQDGAVCYNIQGQEAWRQQFGQGDEGKKPRVGTGANPSPVTDGQHVVVYFKSGTLAGLTVDGRVLWQVNLQDRYGKDTLWWDLGTSPILAGNRVVIAVMQEGSSYLVALDVETGDVLWKQSREYQTAVESDQAYTTPQLVSIDGRDVIVTWGADHLTGHDAATGKLLWESGGFNSDNAKNWRVIASATVGDGMAVVSYGRGEFLAGVRVGGSGDVTQSNRAWEKDRGAGADVPTPVVADGKAYLLGDQGRVTCLDIKSGKEIWSTELPRNRSRYYASPVLAGDKLYCTRQDGVVFVGRVGDDGLQQLAANEMGEWIIATPVPIRGGLLLRGEEHLFWVKPVSHTAAGG